jgi:serine/threonine protein kinase
MLFDFGLAKEVHEEEDCKDGTYKLTPNTGSIRYIAPENANSWPYNYLADCYSFGILLWEVAALERPYAHLTPKDIRDMVITWGERPKIKEGWSARVVGLIKSAWDAHYSKRPTMKEIKAELELELSH